MNPLRSSKIWMNHQVSPILKCQKKGGLFHSPKPPSWRLYEVVVIHFKVTATPFFGWQSRRRLKSSPAKKWIRQNGPCLWWRFHRIGLWFDKLWLISWPCSHGKNTCSFWIIFFGEIRASNWHVFCCIHIDTCYPLKMRFLSFCRINTYPSGDHVLPKCQTSQILPGILRKKQTFQGTCWMNLKWSMLWHAIFQSFRSFWDQIRAAYHPKGWGPSLSPIRSLWDGRDLRW